MLEKTLSRPFYVFVTSKHINPDLVRHSEEPVRRLGSTRHFSLFQTAKKVRSQNVNGSRGLQIEIIELNIRLNVR